MMRLMATVMSTATSTESAKDHQHLSDGIKGGK